MNFFKNIVESGLVKTDAYQKKRGIVLSNHIALILCGCNVILLFTRLLLLHNLDVNSTYNLMMGMALFLFTIVLNRLHFTTLSRLWLSAMPYFYLWYMFVQVMTPAPVIQTTDFDGMRIFLLALSCVPYLLLDRKQWPVFVLGILPAFVSIVFLPVILRLIGMDPAVRGVPGVDFDFIQVRTIVAFFMISSCCIAFQVIIINNDEFNQRLVHELQEKTHEIETQNEELLQSQDNLNEINQHLENLVEERTQKVRNQNEILLKYAYTNAHHVRGPVARVLGLIELSRMNTELDYAWFFEKVEHETKTIDSIIKRIGTELEPGN